MILDKTKVVVINRAGQPISLEQWQKEYNLPQGSTKISKYFDMKEDRFQKDIQMYGKVIINELLFRVADQFREDVGHPQTINALNRNQDHQNTLHAQGFRTATHSPHLVKEDRSGISGAFALDVDTASNEQTDKEVVILVRAARKLAIKIRIGWQEYKAVNMTFIHYDVGPEYYAPGKPWNHITHPLAWEKESRW
jgi:hypothetical protein